MYEIQVYYEILYYVSLYLCVMNIFLHMLRSRIFSNCTFVKNCPLTMFMFNPKSDLILEE